MKPDKHSKRSRTKSFSAFWPRVNRLEWPRVNWSEGKKLTKQGGGGVDFFLSLQFTHGQNVEKLFIQGSKQTCQDLCWKIHDRVQSFVLLSYRMPLFGDVPCAKSSKIQKWVTCGHTTNR